MRNDRQKDKKRHFRTSFANEHSFIRHEDRNDPRHENHFEVPHS